jgi:TPR repeat protein
VSQSYERAAELYQQAASQGHVYAQAGLGALYRDGLGVPQSYERAAELWKQAASKGHADGQACLGALYRDGLGVPKDVARAIALYKQAAAGGDKYAADALRELGGAAGSRGGGECDS